MTNVERKQKIERIISINEKRIKDISKKIDSLLEADDSSLQVDIDALYDEIRTYEEWDSAYRYVMRELELDI